MDRGFYTMPFISNRVSYTQELQCLANYQYLIVCDKHLTRTQLPSEKENQRDTLVRINNIKTRQLLETLLQHVRGTD